MPFDRLMVLKLLVVQAGSDKVTRLGIETRYTLDAAADIPVRHVGVIGVVLVPPLVGEAHETVRAELFLDRALQMVSGKGNWVVARKSSARTVSCASPT